MAPSRAGGRERGWLEGFRTATRGWAERPGWAGSGDRLGAAAGQVLFHLVHGDDPDAGLQGLGGDVLDATLGRDAPQTTVTPSLTNRKPGPRCSAGARPSRRAGGPARVRSPAPAGPGPRGSWRRTWKVPPARRTAHHRERRSAAASAPSRANLAGDPAGRFGRLLDQLAADGLDRLAAGGLDLDAGGLRGGDPVGLERRQAQHVGDHEAAVDQRPGQLAGGRRLALPSTRERWSRS